jgi:hypothetical protein
MLNSTRNSGAMTLASASAVYAGLLSLVSNFALAEFDWKRLKESFHVDRCNLGLKARLGAGPLIIRACIWNWIPNAKRSLLFTFARFALFLPSRHRQMTVDL